jgi:hypothetical protein
VQILYDAVAGGVIEGGGSAYDVSLRNKTGTTALRIPTGTTNAEVVGTISASNLSGTNSGDETGASVTAKLSAFTGDVTKAAGGTALSISNNAVSYAKLQNASASRLIGNPTGAAAAVSEIGLGGGLTFSGSNLSLGAITPTSVAANGAVTSAGGGLGYATGAGGAVTQQTSKSTAVTLNKPCGQVTTSNASLAAAAVVSFAVSSSQVAATDTINLNLVSGNATAGTYRYWVEGVAAGSFKIMVENRSAGALAEALTFNFAALKAVNA